MISSLKNPTESRFYCMQKPKIKYYHNRRGVRRESWGIEGHGLGKGRVATGEEKRKREGATRRGGGGEERGGGKILNGGQNWDFTPQ